LNVSSEVFFDEIVFFELGNFSENLIYFFRNYNRGFV
jgi:hypothetical protein